MAIPLNKTESRFPEVFSGNGFFNAQNASILRFNHFLEISISCGYKGTRFKGVDIIDLPVRNDGVSLGLEIFCHT